ncbi:44416_t:CDS:2, partial [Gigaspora margarita]
FGAKWAQGGFMMWIKAAPAREAQGDLAYMPNYMTWWIFMLCLPMGPVPMPAGAAAAALPAHGPCPHASGGSRSGAAEALTAHGSCPHAIPHYSLNKRALLPDLE